MPRKFFGTDGVRGRANSYPMTADFCLKLGAAAGKQMPCTMKTVYVTGAPNTCRRHRSTDTTAAITIR